MLGYLLMVKLFMGVDVGGRPMLFAGVLFALAGVQLVTTGVLAEILTRNAPAKAYAVRSASAMHERRWKAGDNE